jgi:hypothetical protein
MPFAKSNLKGKQVLQLSLAAIGACLWLTPAKAETINPSQEATLIAQSSVCPPNSGGSQFVTAETRSFYVYICGGDNPNTYVGVAKNANTGGIILPLRSYTNDRFVAVNRNVTYTLTRNELIVSRNGRVIQRERATWKW